MNQIIFHWRKFAKCKIYHTVFTCTYDMKYRINTHCIKFIQYNTVFESYLSLEALPSCDHRQEGLIFWCFKLKPSTLAGSFSDYWISSMARTVRVALLPVYLRQLWATARPQLATKNNKKTIWTEWCFWYYLFERRFSQKLFLHKNLFFILVSECARNDFCSGIKVYFEKYFLTHFTVWS